MNVLYCTNNDYLKHVCVSIHSLIKSNPKQKIRVKVLGYDIDKNSSKKFDEFTELHKSYEIKLEAFDKSLLSDFPQIGVYTKDIYLRLWCDHYFEDADKVLYLDADTIVEGPIAELWNEDLSEHLVAAVTIPNAGRRIRDKELCDYPYVNSGVLLINIKKWTSLNVRENLRMFLIENSEIALNPDQDALNDVFYDQIKIVDYKWNAISPFFRNTTFNGMKPETQQRVQENAVVIHFNGQSRPWFYLTDHPYKEKYQAHLAETPWKHEKYSDFTVLSLFKRYFKKLIKYPTGYIELNDK
jgi:lipopolysaccharide biosynthesis glycosyltransferase